jgi:hypothetical protein
MRKFIVIPAVIIAFSGFSWMFSKEDSKTDVQPSAYAGHENDRDIHNFIQQYPESAGSRLDDCQTCHRGGIAGTDTEREFSPCGYCHLIEFPNPRYKTGVPGNFEATLNAYGLAYKKNGRNLEALSSIADIDSDGDGYSNAAEISEKRYPGESASQPGQPLSPIITLGWNRIQSLPHHTQFMLMNRTTQQYDAYAGYTGVRVKDLLAATEVDLNGVAGVTVFAPDGYSIDYTIAEVLEPFPKGYFYAGPGTIEEEEKQFVLYPKTIPADVVDGEKIPDEPWLLLAFELNNSPLESSYYESGSGHLVGEGPYRLVKPQHNLMGDASKPGRPDRSVKSKSYGDGWDYSKSIDHNAGNCIRGATAIRLNPMPSGYEEYNWKNSWPLIDSRQLVIFGRGISKKQ